MIVIVMRTGASMAVPVEGDPLNDEIVLIPLGLWCDWTGTVDHDGRRIYLERMVS